MLRLKLVDLNDFTIHFFNGESLHVFSFSDLKGCEPDTLMLSGFQINEEAGIERLLSACEIVSSSQKRIKATFDLFNGVLHAGFYTNSQYLSSFLTDSESDALADLLVHPKVRCSSGLFLGFDVSWAAASLRTYDATKACSEINAAYITSESNAVITQLSEKHQITLAHDQASAVACPDQVVLVNAGPGAGKTYTIVGKVCSLLDAGVDPASILCLSYSSMSAKELSDRIAKHSPDVKCSTFHSLGLSIIGQAKGLKPRVLSNNHELIQKCIAERISSSPDFYRSYIQLAAYLPDSAPVHSFDSLAAYSDHLLKSRSARRQGQEVVIKTLSGCMVRSMEEAFIANFLFLLGVDFEYEKPHPCAEPDSDHRIYTPDFYLPAADLWWEHFALDQNGRAPSFMPGYLEGVSWKRQFASRHGYNLFETTSHDYQSNQLADKIINKLTSLGIDLSHTTADETRAAAKRAMQAVTRVDSTIIAAVATLKANNAYPEKVRSDNSREDLFNSVVSSIYHLYQSQLNAGGLVDFDDMIHMASSYVKERAYRSPYLHIIVDEFQDISASRMGLISALHYNNASSKCFFVGDDCQAIYKFAGSNYQFMTNLHAALASSSITTMPIYNNYRNHPDICDLASAFVNQNPSQIKKVMISSKSRDLASFECFHISMENQSAYLDLALSSLNDSGPSTVMLLGRYKRNKPAELERYQSSYPNLTIRYSTAHSSKGLEADHVFILNCEYGTFPSTIVDEQLLVNYADLDGIKEPYFPFSEERRLFFVAITRARQSLVIFSNKNNKSPFTDWF